MCIWFRSQRNLKDIKDQIKTLESHVTSKEWKKNEYFLNLLNCGEKEKKHNFVCVLSSNLAVLFFRHLQIQSVVQFILKSIIKYP